MGTERTNNLERDACWVVEVLEADEREDRRVDSPRGYVSDVTVDYGHSTTPKCLTKLKFGAPPAMMLEMEAKFVMDVIRSSYSHQYKIVIAAYPINGGTGRGVVDIYDAHLRWSNKTEE